MEQQTKIKIVCVLCGKKEDHTTDDDINDFCYGCIGKSDMGVFEFIKYLDIRTISDTNQVDELLVAEMGQEEQEYYYENLLELEKAEIKLGYEKKLLVMKQQIDKDIEELQKRYDKEKGVD